MTTAIATACRPLLAGLAMALALLPGRAFAQATAPAASGVAPRVGPEETTAQAQATVLLLTRRVDSLRLAYRQQQRLYSDLGGKFTSFLAGQKLSHNTRFALAKNNVRATADLLLVCHSRLTQLRALTQALRNANEQAALSSPIDSNPLGISLVEYTKTLVTNKAVDKGKGRRLVDLAAHLSQSSYVTALPTVGPMLNAERPAPKPPPKPTSKLGHPSGLGDFGQCKAAIQALLGGKKSLKNLEPA